MNKIVKTKEPVMISLQIVKILIIDMNQIFKLNNKAIN